MLLESSEFCDFEFEMNKEIDISSIKKKTVTYFCFDGYCAA